MGNLLTSLLHSTEAMRVFDRQLAVVQNNVTNANTPGYVRQTQTLVAEKFQLDRGLTGGVSAGPVASARSDYAESGVRRESTLLGRAQQQADDLGQIESLFSLSAPSSVSSALSRFFQSFSQLSVNPNSQVSRQNTLDRSKDIAGSFNQTALGLSAASQNADFEIRNMVGTINRLAGQLRDFNQIRRADFAANSDAGLDAQIHATLEELSLYANFSVLEQPDGTMTVYLGDQTPLVVGENVYSISADFSSPVTEIRDSTGWSINHQISGGKLAGLLDEKNVLIPGYVQELNLIAREFAQRVNAQLQAGVDRSGASPVIDLFAFNSTVGEAISLTVTSISPDQIAAAEPGAAGGNGNALKVAEILNQRLPSGFTLTQQFGNLGGQVGRDLSAAREQKTTQTSMLAQARNLRTQLSGVDVNEEAARLIQIQRSYQAAGKLVGVLNELTETVINLIR